MTATPSNKADPGINRLVARAKISAPQSTVTAVEKSPRMSEASFNAASDSGSMINGGIESWSRLKPAFIRHIRHPYAASMHAPLKIENR